MTEQAVTVYAEPQAPAVQRTPMDLIEQAMVNGAEMETLERLWALQEKYEANEARKAFHLAMSAFKKNPPKIQKDALVDYKAGSGRTTYAHATLGNITEKINGALSEHDLSAAWKTEQLENGQIKITCTITHAMGHSENTSLTSAPDESGGKNKIQAIGSTVTYLQRYTLLALTGLATKDQDDDGKTTTPKKKDLSKMSPEYKAMSKTKEMFPEIYTEAVQFFGSEPDNTAKYKQVNDWINQQVSQQDNK